VYRQHLPVSNGDLPPICNKSMQNRAGNGSNMELHRTCLELFAEAARAFRVSFLLLASASLPSIALVLPRSWSTAFDCCSN
jgi:hypothetical protein